MALSLDNEAFEFVFLDCSIALVFPKPFYMSCGEEFQDKPWFFGVGLSIDDNFIMGDIEIIRVILS